MLVLPWMIRDDAKHICFPWLCAVLLDYDVVVVFAVVVLVFDVVCWLVR